jgi:hypothetical protein
MVLVFIALPLVLNPTMATTKGLSLPTSCVCCMATILLAPVSAAEKPLLLYQPDTNVDETAALELDQRSIVASLAARDEEGLTEAKNIYMLGREEDDMSSAAGAMTLKSLSTLAQEEFLGVSSTYQDFVDYYGDNDYADQWISAAFGGAQTSMSNDVNIDFGKFDIEGRGGKVE